MNLQDFKVTYTGGSVNVTLPDFRATGKVVSDDGHAVVADYTADADGVSIPLGLASLPPETIAHLLVEAGLPERMLMMKAGVA